MPPRFHPLRRLISLFVLLGVCLLSSSGRSEEWFVWGESEAEEHAGLLQAWSEIEERLLDPKITSERERVENILGQKTEDYLKSVRTLIEDGPLIIGHQFRDDYWKAYDEAIVGLMYCQRSFEMDDREEWSALYSPDLSDHELFQYCTLTLTENFRRCHRTSRHLALAFLAHEFQHYYDEKLHGPGSEVQTFFRLQETRAILMEWLYLKSVPSEELFDFNSWDPTPAHYSDPSFVEKVIKIYLHIGEFDPEDPAWVALFRDSQATDVAYLDELQGFFYSYVRPESSVSDLAAVYKDLLIPEAERLLEIQSLVDLSQTPHYKLIERVVPYSAKHRFVDEETIRLATFLTHTKYPEVLINRYLKLKEKKHLKQVFPNGVTWDQKDQYQAVIREFRKSFAANSNRAYWRSLRQRLQKRFDLVWPIFINTPK